jgi:acetyl-CoA synthetase
MVRYSVTMDDDLTATIDKSCEKRKISRSEWINEACTTHLTSVTGTSITGATSLLPAGPVGDHIEHNMPDYDVMYRSFKIDVPEYFNFGFDVVDAWAKKDRNKLAMIWVNQDGEEKKFTFWDLMRLSNQIVNMMIKYGLNKGDRVLVMLPRVPEWWIFTLALIKRGAVYCPAPTMLTPKDLKYRINIADIKMVITSEEYADRIDAIIKDCPTLSCRMMVDGR